MSISKVSENKCFEGMQLRYCHFSQSLQCDMHFSIYMPSIAKTEKVPVLYWLSGLTCSDENFVHKAGAQQYAEQFGIAIVAPDTSPRGEDVPDDIDKAYDLGLGAGFYVNATEQPWQKHYQMYQYIVDELPEIIANGFNVDITNASISGHSMGGHGALTIALKNSEKYKSVSAFAPISAPMQSPWGKKAFTAYFGDQQLLWQSSDASYLVQESPKKLPTLIDQGASDNFLEEQLKPELFNQACKNANYPITYNLREGYDHSYYFISTFIGSHIEFHATHLKNGKQQ